VRYYTTVQLAAQWCVGKHKSLEKEIIKQLPGNLHEPEKRRR